MHSSARINSLIKIKYKAIENYNETKEKKLLQTVISTINYQSLNK